MGSAQSSGNGIARVRKTNSVRWDLVVNALVLWNTRYLDAALSHLLSQGAEVKPENVA
jgi:TnpA family transposase